ncbi:MAG: hypothetical protein CMN29_22075 [Sandaracinus sp.]|nr:hypothetical protein [Sandaracinus sp.]HJK92870.1 GGDEF domain-containing protein [Polyangiaceae bacterium LLY-WYZ-15_(1-7)]
MFLSATVVTITSVAVFAILGTWGALEDVDWPDVFGELSVALLSVVWLIVLHRLDTPVRVFRPLVLGMLALFMGELWDVLDEFAVVEMGSVIENIGKIAGMAFASVGVFQWWSEQKQRQDALKATSDRFEQLSLTDPLTGVFNRAYFDQKLAVAMPETKEAPPLSLILMDLDDFKVHNDTFGHVEGDKVIQALAEVVRARIRDSDQPCRYGGEEFAVLLPGADRETAATVADRIRAGFAQRVFEPRRGEEVRKTVSLGVAQALVGEEPEAFVHRCDEALYEAKEAGKNRVQVAR